MLLYTIISTINFLFMLLGLRVLFTVDQLELRVELLQSLDVKHVG